MGWGTAAQLRALLRDTQTTIAKPIQGKGVTASTTTAPSASPAPRGSHPPAALEDLFQALQILATQHGWDNQYTYNADGPDAGLHVILVRDVVLFAEVALTPKAFTHGQQAWLARLLATGQVEAYGWTPADMPQITARLSRAREA